MHKYVPTSRGKGGVRLNRQRAIPGSFGESQTQIDSKLFFGSLFKDAANRQAHTTRANASSGSAPGREACPGLPTEQVPAIRTKEGSEGFVRGMLFASEREADPKV